VTDSIARLLIEQQPNSGAWNMALDEALLESAVHRGRCTVRVYRWSEPTVSLGYFQRSDEIEPGSAWAALPRVRRLSGGGAILHHLEWTYSCAVPPGHRAIRTPGSLYETAHRRIVDVLNEFAVEAALRGESAGTTAFQGRREDAALDGRPWKAVLRDAGRPSDGPQPFLCFARGDSRDVVLHGHKIVGSAQRRRKGAVLQHGSILLQASPFAPELPGIVDLAGDFPPAEFLGEQIGRSIAVALSETIETAAPTAEELVAARRAVQN